MNVFHMFSRVIILSILTLGLLTPVSAQFGKLKRKINERVDRKVDQKVNEQVDNALDKLFKKVEDAVNEGEQSSSGDSTASSKREKNTFSTQEDEIDETVLPSKWTGTFTLVIEEYKKDKMRDDYPQLVRYHIDEYKIAFEQLGTPTPALVIVNRQTRRMTTKMTDEEGKKTAFSMKMPNITLDLDEEEFTDEDGDFDLRPTGRTKQIMGYNCREYKYTNEDDITLTWVTDEMGFNIMELFQFVQVQNQQTGQSQTYPEYAGVTGSILESTSINEKEKTKSHMLVEDVQEGQVDSAVFSLEGYDTMSVPDILGKDTAEKLNNIFNNSGND
ncbi:MAG: DUF4412 domain-containing protein [Bacteroidota bacterium]